MNGPLPSELFRVGGVESGCFRAEATADMLYLYESVHAEEPESMIALEIDEARILLAFLKTVVPHD